MTDERAAELLVELFERSRASGEHEAIMKTALRGLISFPTPACELALTVYDDEAQSLDLRKMALVVLCETAAPAELAPLLERLVFDAELDETLRRTACGYWIMLVAEPERLIATLEHDCFQQMRGTILRHLADLDPQAVVAELRARPPRSDQEIDARLIALLPPGEAVPLLVHQTGSRFPQITARAIAALVRIGSPEALAAIRPFTVHGEEVSLTNMELFKLLEREHAFALLDRYLDEDAASSRVYAAYSLFEVGGQGAHHRALRLLREDPDAEVRRAARNTLRNLGVLDDAELERHAGAQVDTEKRTGTAGANGF